MTYPQMIKNNTGWVKKSIYCDRALRGALMALWRVSLRLYPKSQLTSTMHLVCFRWIFGKQVTRLYLYLKTRALHLTSLVFGEIAISFEVKMWVAKYLVNVCLKSRGLSVAHLAVSIAIAKWSCLMEIEEITCRLQMREDIQWTINRRGVLENRGLPSMINSSDNRLGNNLTKLNWQIIADGINAV